MDAIIAIGLLVSLPLLGLAALRWGVDSTDGPESPEWNRRRAWRGLHS
jgi:hypothetical protein